MNIVHLINYAGLGGSENYVRILIENQSQKHKCHLVYGIDDGLIKSLGKLKVKFKQIQMKHPFDFNAVKSLHTYCVENKIDVIHCHYPRENCIATQVKKKLPKLKVIFTAHLNEPCNKLWKYLNAKASALNDAVIAVCNSQLTLLEENGYDPSKIKVIHNATTLKPFTEKDRESAKNALRSEFKIPDHVPIICTVTRFEPVKGIPYLIRAMAYYTKIEPIEARLIIVGTGSQFEEIKEMIRSMRMEKYIICTGYREDADRLVLGSDIYVNSSESEALSFALINAGASQVACIATNVGGNTDIVDPKCGILVEYGDSEELAKAIDILICKDELRAEYAQNLQKKVFDSFTLDKMLSATQKLYK